MHRKEPTHPLLLRWRFILTLRRAGFRRTTEHTSFKLVVAVQQEEEARGLGRSLRFHQEAR